MALVASLCTCLILQALLHAGGAIHHLTIRIRVGVVTLVLRSIHAALLTCTDILWCST
jgi:hypothetical protein